MSSVVMDGRKIPHKRGRQRQKSTTPTKILRSNDIESIEDPLPELQSATGKTTTALEGPSDQRNYRRFSARSRKKTDFYCPTTIQDYIKNCQNSSKTPKDTTRTLVAIEGDRVVKQMVPPPEKNTYREYTPHVVMLHDQQMPSEGVSESMSEGVVNNSGEGWNRTSVIKEVLPKVS